MSSYVQLLTPDGIRVNHPDYEFDLTEEQCRALYRDLVTVRRFDAEAVTLQRQGELGLWPSLFGQEAAQIGSGRALRAQDTVFPAYREHAVLYCRGVDPIMPFQLFRGVDFGAWDPRETRVHLYTLVVGAQLLHATGYAMGVAMDGCELDETAEAVIAYFGDGASAQGDVNEAFVWASVFHAPIVFFCQNNQYAISQPVDRQSAVPLYQRAAGFGFPGIQVDGNDAFAVHAVTRAALDRARRGAGPVLIEAYTYRMGAHTTSDDPTRYRDSAEVEEWRLKDPVARVRRYLERGGSTGADFFADVDAEAERQVMQLRARVLAIPDPPQLATFDRVYPEGSPLLTAQRDQFARYRATFGSIDVDERPAGPDVCHPTTSAMGGGIDG